MPVEPLPSRWALPDRDALAVADDDPEADDADDLVAVGADLEPGTVLAAYRSGLFPMPLAEPGSRAARRSRDPVGWWSPVRRGVVELDGLRVSRSLRRSCRDFEVRVDTAFDEVIEACADPDRPHGWIDHRIQEAYCHLHELGWAHSVEAWRDGRLEGGLYGLAIGGLFAGESMFHRARDASKVALVGLVDLLRDEHAEGRGDRLVDVQWVTPHLATLGAVEVDRSTYLDRLPGLLATPLPAPWR